MMQDRKHIGVYKRIVTFKQLDLITWVVYEQRIHKESNTCFYDGEKIFDNALDALSHFDKLRK